MGYYNCHIAGRIIICTRTLFLVILREDDMMRYIYQVDAFTQTPFSGNPAGVMVLDREESADWMGLLAREMNLSETAFLLLQAGVYQLRWFTPSVEVELCGHATLASAHILYEEGFCRKTDPIIFDTASGELQARNLDGWIELDFPAFKWLPVDYTAQVNEILKQETRMVFESGENLLVELESEKAVRALTPDINKMKELPFQGVIVTSVSDEPAVDFVSRYFAPQVGIDEDPVTGSAHCSLAPYWAAKLNKTDLFARQVSMRGGDLKLRTTPERVYIMGQAITIFKAELKF